MALPLRPLVLVSLLAGCSSDDTKEPVGDGSNGSSVQREDAAIKDASVRRDSSLTTQRDTSTTQPDDTCASVSERAEARLQPVDIVWAIDTSGSMTASFPAIQQALTSFSSKVTQAGIDAHIVLLAGAGLCVPAPVGSGQCGVGLGGGLGGFGVPIPAPDTKQPGFLHLDVPFGANQGMPVLLDNYPNYRDLLRSEAHTHLVLTEDGVPLTSADAVVSRIEGSGAGAWSPGLAPGSWTFHGVVCKNGIGGGACLLAFGVPTTTLELVQRSGGIAADLSQAGSATDPFAALLDELATRVIVGAELSCEYDIPAVPQGQAFNRNLVNVAVTSAQGDRTIPQAKAGACEDHDAWAYDDDANPTKIVLCPAACDAVRAEQEAKLDVKFGCQTIVLL